MFQYFPFLGKGTRGKKRKNSMLSAFLLIFVHQRSSESERYPKLDEK